MTDTHELRHDEPMSRHTSWRVGGPADLFFRPRSVASLQAFLRALPAATPLTWIGLGSNLLVRDGGLRGAVICLSGLPRTFELLGNGRVRVSAGLPCATLARRAARAGLGPAAFFAGIPGSVGGALAMNAGAFGGETWDRVVAIETLDRHGEPGRHGRSDFEIGYRSVRGIAGRCFIGAELAFDPASDRDAADIHTLLERRAMSQPIGPPSAGSVFRNPTGGHAAALIEAAGLKGRRIGGAVVAEKHANFILNEGAATAADIEALIAAVRAAVLERFDVELETEVRVVGESAESGT
jgi:UDP-N-acetylmuramate dehydrogenase